MRCVLLVAVCRLLLFIGDCCLLFVVCRLVLLVVERILFVDRLPLVVVGCLWFVASCCMVLLCV